MNGIWRLVCESSFQNYGVLHLFPGNSPALVPGFSLFSHSVWDFQQNVFIFFPFWSVCMCYTCMCSCVACVWVGASGGYPPTCGGVHTWMWRDAHLYVGRHACMWGCTPVCGGCTHLYVKGCTPACGGMHTCMWGVHTCMWGGTPTCGGAHLYVKGRAPTCGGCTPTCGGLRLMLRLFLHSSPTFVQTEALTPSQHSPVWQISLTKLVLQGALLVRSWPPS